MAGPPAEIGIGTIPAPPRRQPTVVVVPVTSVSRLTQHALSEAMSLGDEVLAVTVVIDGAPAGPPEVDVERQLARVGSGGARCASCTPTTRRSSGRSSGWWTSCGPDGDRQVVVLIPVVIPEKLRYRLLHNQVDLALASELRRRTDVVVARVPMPIGRLGEDRGAGPTPGAGEPSTAEPTPGATEPNG